MIKSLFIRLTEGQREEIILAGHKVKLYIVKGIADKKYAGDIKVIIAKVSANIPKYIKFVVSSIYPDYKKYYSQGEVHSKEDLQKSLKPEYISIHQDGGVTLDFYEGGKFFRGHIIELVLTPKLVPERAPSLQG